MNYLKNPDPAWPEVWTLAFSLVALWFAVMVGEIPFSQWLSLYWWPFLRMVLVVWAILRFLDFVTGGIGRRAYARTLYWQARRGQR